MLGGYYKQCITIVDVWSTVTVAVSVAFVLLIPSRSE
jgi:hypothetical protein